MGTRANYIVTGAFTLAVIVGVFGFIFWFQNTAGGGERSSYRVVFAARSRACAPAPRSCSTASGSAGLRLGLDAHDPHKVVATIFSRTRRAGATPTRK
jgi:ABC-type transport system involved in resistance to organic solvents, periplasmic component